MLSRRWSAFLLAVGVWSWIIWPTFLRNIWKDDRSFDPRHSGPTAFLLVHVALTVASLIIGTLVGVLGWRGFRAASRRRAERHRQSSHSEPAPTAALKR